MVPGVGNVTTAFHSVLLGAPLPPLASQPFAQRNEVTAPGSEAALWNPPPLTNVTVSPALMFNVAGENVRPFGSPTLTFQLVAQAGAAARPSRIRAGRLRVRNG